MRKRGESGETWVLLFYILKGGISMGTELELAKVYLMDDNGKKYELIKVGAPGDYLEGEDKDARCRDCGAKMGEYHQLYCDIQRCPICGGQLLSCDHAELRIYHPRHIGRSAK